MSVIWKRKKKKIGLTIYDSSLEQCIGNNFESIKFDCKFGLMAMTGLDMKSIPSYLTCQSKRYDKWMNMSWRNRQWNALHQLKRVNVFGNITDTCEFFFFFCKIALNRIDSIDKRSRKRIKCQKSNDND